MHIHTAAATIAYTPVALEKAEPLPSFQIKIATPLDADTLGYEMYRRNVIPVTQETLRATVVDDLFNLFTEEEAENHCATLDEVWQAEELFENEMAIWREQERWRVRDEAAGAPRAAALPMPRRHVSLRTRAKSQLLMDDVTQRSQRIRDLSVQMSSYPRRQAAMILRMHIVGWSGLSAPCVLEDDLLSEASLASLFEEIGVTAYREIERFCSGMYELGEEEVKNSDLPLENEPGEIGSPAPSGDSASSDGSSTGLLTASTPGVGSAETTAPLSTSTSG